ncbi:hypothetical protein MPL3365_60006 [Mesorhizobium plurifarium]|uniref:Uncharacterized protein n=1 Tax=Mesorhizobium plurifarium TaxID=69974 RepID=A0A090GGD6_MESPL|nr:hypothetical protein MPL3365_60006 [Mesorhizobium plurifarium]
MAGALSAPPRFTPSCRRWAWSTTISKAATAGRRWRRSARNSKGRGSVTPTSPLWGGRAEGAGGGRRVFLTPTPTLRVDPPHKGEGKLSLLEPALMAAAVDVPDQAGAGHRQHQPAEAAIVGRVMRGGGAAAGRDDLDRRALPHPTALAVLVIRAIGEREFEAAVFLQQQFGTDLHDAVQIVVAGKTGIARLAGVGRAGRANDQRAGKRARKLQLHDDPPIVE